MRIAIFGSGAVGGYFGARLAAAGNEVVFIARGAHLAAMRQHGLRVSSINGDMHIHPLQASDDPASVGEVDLVLVAVKSWQIDAAAQAMQPLLGANTIVLPLLNGVEAPQQLAAVLGRRAILGGMCKIIAILEGPGHIRHAGANPYIALGEVDGAPSTRAAEVKRILNHAKIHAEVPADIQVAMWEKFLFISAVSGVGAVSRAPIGIIRSVPQLRQMLQQSMEEIFALAKARGIALAENIIEATLQFLDTLPEDGTASMQRDIMEGRPSELEAQTGAVVRLGREAGVPTPINSFIYNSLLPLELKARGVLKW